MEWHLQVRDELKIKASWEDFVVAGSFKKRMLLILSSSTTPWETNFISSKVESVEIV